MRLRGGFARALLAAGALLLLAPAQAGEVLQGIKARGWLRCGVREGIAGFSEQDASGRWQGMDADFCRAVAAAVLGDPEKVRFVPLKSSTGFPALRANAIDLLVGKTSWTLTREALLKVQFAGVLFYDGQGFLVANSARIKSLADLNGATICVEKGTTHAGRLSEYFRLRGLAVTPLVIDSASAAAGALYGGRCQALTSDAAQLAAVRSRAPGGAQYVLLPERISKEPLGPVVRGGDAEWATLVRWVLHMLVAAEEFGITRGNIDTAGLQSRSTNWALVSGQDQRIARALGVPGDWALRAVRAVGNYGEVYERNVGSGSPLNIERGLNRVWTQRGLHYAPPID